MQRTAWRGGFGESWVLPEDVAELVAIADAREAALVDVDPITALKSKLGANGYLLPVMVGAVAVGLALLWPSGGRRR